MRVSGIDHFVLTVRNIEATCDFYSNVLGMEIEEFGGGRRALKFGSQKINLHQAGNEFKPKAEKPTPGSGDFCLTTDVSLKRVVEHLSSCGIEIVEGPVQRTGATGRIESVYFRDPDGNLVEVSNYTDDIG
ncbi:MAG: VOC family protein [Actinobacteria bacterium]|jgi:catechol 2,3-dioxygenase-like lactoylglutathione lyase family enzyme|nr:VOC family protein [Actinomycetota bacterium]MCA1737342.1 VOC family protein [Actinomycetota bacterium]